VEHDDTHHHLEQPRSMFGSWIGVVLLFSFFGVLVWAVMGLMPRGDRYEETRSEARRERLKTTTEEHEKALKEYGWVDKEKGVVRVPVSRALELSVAELAQRKPAPANPIDPAAGEKAGLQVTAPMAPAPAPDAAPDQQASPTPKAVAVEGPDSTTRGQPAAAANPPDAPAGTQPGPDATPAASPAAPSGQPPAKDAERAATPVQSPAGTPLPVPGRDPMPPASPAPEQR
jgi:hypothetical protein